MKSVTIGTGGNKTSDFISRRNEPLQGTFAKGFQRSQYPEQIRSTNFIFACITTDLAQRRPFRWTHYIFSLNYKISDAKTFSVSSMARHKTFTRQC
ncbi:uncharacterized protein OCT59_025821 [Rhizophagus irregularis]|uniref:Uncharacterized protein n=1 Tax=Rhizophagus irregularis TaxID=588596 RepID=A0A915YWM1_9GLOM|nr:hypothetical protein OCT59_025821 [Rhizophagus irregularis]GBC12532.2 hypothetical protein RIR_jg3772.t1 [Rhizophagus irregularis DAOM 181602=DAOM 197198]CAB4377374.1 unnamed protein product [Rhizophagus irregularis]CAB4492345.1 unnamed protein product [Rhizophagus irregularis]CAB5350476.1 unnamed protein product [Rhizophagus irregularis]